MQRIAASGRQGGVARVQATVGGKRVVPRKRRAAASAAAVAALSTPDRKPSSSTPREKRGLLDDDPLACHFSAWFTVDVPLEELDLSLTLPAGQAFRWRSCAQGVRWYGVLGRQALQLERVDADCLRCRYAPMDTPSAIVRAQLHDFLRWHPDAPRLTALYRQWSAADTHFGQVAPYLAGARVLRHDPVECLFSFICSSNNNIKRISGMVTYLARRYGQPVIPARTAEDNHDVRTSYYTFPSVETLAQQATVDDLRQHGFGYRAEFVVQAARALQARGGTAYLLALRDESDRREVHRQLTALPGVGRKVASCVALLSLDCADDIPVDTHVWQIAVRSFAHAWHGKTLTEKRYDAIGDAFRERFGPYAGWAHNVLFAAELADYQQRLPEGMRVARRVPEAARRRTSPGKKERAVLESSV
ncbi:hypothetical protein CDCA_CDCA08G2461 [Cyanidium caldarium]|uniref:DNA-(apurinic or apyrimidinic site) lyase n=1 Tax=Cyanidium caldarium TaxID=2771 RepID=A0AAV9IW96_CYACA|nr:hypothetical protein CDCA_CDCA08G2461 [Cyanidium caldarium]|eukprot:ctg_2013.g728